MGIILCYIIENLDRQRERQSRDTDGVVMKDRNLAKSRQVLRLGNNKNIIIA